MDLGQQLRGVDVGPSALRYAGLARQLKELGYRVEDSGNIDVAIRDAHRGRDFHEPIRISCERIYAEVRKCVDEGHLPIVMGGDHSIAIGTIGGATHLRAVGVVWIDAHADFNTPATSPSGNVHGMPLAILCGHGPASLLHVGRAGAKITPDDVVLISLRAIDRSEGQQLRNQQFGVYTMREVDEQGIGAVTRAALDRLKHHDRLHVSLDMDSIDPMFAPGVGTPVPGGLNTREGHLLMELLSEDGRVSSIDIVEINPLLDERNRTAELAAQLLASLLGKTIL